MTQSGQKLAEREGGFPAQSSTIMNWMGLGEASHCCWILRRFSRRRYVQRNCTNSKLERERLILKHTIFYTINLLKKGYWNNSIVPFFRVGGFNGPEYLNGGGYRAGISGSWGQFLAIWTSITLALFFCMGGDIVIVTTGEARHPRRDLPPVTRFMYLVPLTFYILVSFLVGLNIDFTNQILFHPWAKPTPVAPDVSHSPIIIIISATSVKIFLTILNVAFMLSAYTAGNTALLTSSRTLFSLSHVYGNTWMREAFGTTNNGNTPVAAILACSGFGLLAFLALCDTNFDQASPFNPLQKT
ncbi:hypothetical protein G7Y89_g5557 [Cudoniella acicularis]|uniref:Amino acid permease/ SLC12A domain-containing protein n=1 Tax=Cudoniella acicularis TaxID=354080 RepID=A0A8H4W3P2_9HELO|nr:hypothetical protein G7Y89_g5557 [Cudoniella acicularis]